MPTPPEMNIDTNTIYRVTIGTDRGDIVMDLDPRLAPKTVNNFVSLARQGYYDNLTFHRVEPGFVIQGGCPEGSGRGGPGYKFEDEPVQGEYLPGTVAMANAGPDTNGSQFFICLSDLRNGLGKQYNLFGQVTSGMDAVQAVQRGDVFRSVTVEEIPRILRLDLPEPVDLVRTLGGLREGARLRPSADGVWWTTRTAEGPATVRFTAVGTLASEVDVTAWGPGAAVALAAAPGMIGAHDDPSDFRPSHPMVAEGWRRHPGLRLGRTGAVMEALVPAIVFQKVPAADAGRTWRRLIGRFGQPAPGPADLVLSPDPTRLARLAYPDLHRFGLERRRAMPLLAACRAAARLEQLARRSTEQLMAGLMQIPGIGQWTALSVARLVHGGPDTVVVGDYNLPALVAWNLAGERTADDERMLELLEADRPHRARVLQVIGAAGSRPPRHGPRLRPAAINL